MAFVRVKICGVTTPADAVIAADCGADAVGLNFYSKSPRFIRVLEAVQIVRALPPFTSPVGVFVDVPPELIGLAVSDLGLRAVQTYCHEPGADHSPAAHIAAFRVKGSESLGEIRQFVESAIQTGHGPAAVLLDAHVDGEMGGTGRTAPWEILAGFDPGVPVILAGGLTPENVADAIRIVRPWAVDVASGVESAPGRKDPGKVRAFVQAVRAVCL